MIIEKGKWLILEKEEDFLSRWDKNWGRWDHNTMTPPKFFPCAFKYCSSFDSHSCGDWFPVPLNEAKNNIEIELEKSILRLTEVLNKVKTL